MKRSLFERATDIVLAALVLWLLGSVRSTVAQSPGPQSSLEQARPLLYLNYYNTFRNAGLVRVNTESNYRISQQQQRLDQSLLRMDRELRRRNALSDEDFRQSELK